MECKFVVGQKVICIAQGDWSRWARELREWYGQILWAPKRGDILTIRAVYGEHDQIGLRFMEIRNQRHPKLNLEYGFPYWEFAPLVRRKTDISIFKKMLLQDCVSA